MKKFLRCVVLAGLGVAAAASASAGELKITMADGRVTVIAQDVPLRQILAEWARVGNTRMVHAEKLTGGPLTLQLIDVPEKEALDILLRSAAGYMVAPRSSNVAGASVYDRVIILATSRPPTGPVTAPPPFGAARQPITQPLPQPPPNPNNDDDGEPGDQGPMPQPVLPPGAQPFPGPMVGPNGQPLPQPAQPFPGPQVPVTSPRPGQLPVQPAPQPMNPYTPVGPDGRPILGPDGRPIVGPDGRPITRPGGPGGQ